MDKILKRKIDEFISAQSYDWSDINCSIEAMRLDIYLQKNGYVKNDDYSMDDLILYYSYIQRDIENVVDCDPDGGDC